MLRAKKHRSVNSPQFNHEIRYQNRISPNSFSISCFHLMWGGGGGDENPDYYVSVKQFESGKGFFLRAGSTKLKITPGVPSGEETPSLGKTISEEGILLSIPGGDPEKTTVTGGTFEITSQDDPGPIESDMDYWVYGGSTGHGFLFINEIQPSSSEGTLKTLNAIKRAFSLDNKDITDDYLDPYETINGISIIIDFDFSNHTATLYFHCEMEKEGDKHPTNIYTKGANFSAL